MLKSTRWKLPGRSTESTSEAALPKKESLPMAETTAVSSPRLMTEPW